MTDCNTTLAHIKEEAQIRSLLQTVLIRRKAMGEIRVNQGSIFDNMKLTLPNMVLFIHGIPCIAVCIEDNELFYEIYTIHHRQKRWTKDFKVPFCLLEDYIFASGDKIKIKRKSKKIKLN